MPGSGKGVVSDVAEKLDFLVVIMGDVIREETMKRGLKPSPENIGHIMLQIRKEEGVAVVAERCIPKIKDAASQYALVEGIRSRAEIEVFRREFPKFKILAIHSSPETRFQRIYNRGRSDDPLSKRDFTNRDLREIKVGIGSAIAMADQVIQNEGSIRQFKIKVKKFLTEIR